MGEPGGDGVAQRGGEPSGVGGDEALQHLGLDFGGAAPGSDLGGCALAEDGVRDHAVEGCDEGAVVAAGAAGRVEQPEFLAFGDDEAGASGHGALGLEHRLDLGRRRVAADDADGGGAAELLERDRPHAHSLALEPDRPEAPLCGAGAVGLAAVAAGLGEHDELGGREFGAARVLAGDEQRGSVPALSVRPAFDGAVFGLFDVRDAALG